MHTYRSNDKVKGRYEPVSNKPSMTVPDMAMSMAEIMARFKRGQELPLGANTYFDTDHGEVDFDSVDPTLNPAFDLSDYTRINEDIKRKKSEAIANEKLLKENSKNSQSSAESEGEAKGAVTERSGVDKQKANTVAVNADSERSEKSS